MLSLSDVCRSRYLLFHELCDCGFPMDRASIAVDVLLGPEPAEELFEPTEADLDDYHAWADRLDRDGFQLEGDDHDNVSDRDVTTVLGCAG